MNIKQQTLDYFNQDELATEVFLKKYSLKKDGEPIETPVEMHQRLAKAFAKIEDKYSNLSCEKSTVTLPLLSWYGRQRQSLINSSGLEEIENEIFNLFDKFKYIIPAGSVMSNLDVNNISSLSNCTVISIKEDSIDGIFKAATEMAQLFKRRAGVGLDISNLRPSEALVNNSAKTSSGAVSFINLFNTITEVVGTNGRRAALMVSIDINHPDILEFIKLKRDHSKIQGANISIKFNKDFIKAVENNEDYILQWPCENKSFKLIDDSYEYNVLYKINNHYIKRVKAKEIWDEFIESNWSSGDPGCYLWHNIIDYDPSSVYKEFKPVSTNPCFTGDTNILTENGFKSLESFSENRLYKLVTDEGKIVNGRIWSNGYKHVIKIIFSNGKFIKCTPEHIFKLIDNTECEAKNLLSQIVKGYDNNHLKVTSIIDENSIEEVFDFTLNSENHWGVIEGLIAHNCGELPLNDGDACRLMCVNLYSLIKNPFTKEAELDEKLAYEIFYEQQCLCDDLVDLEIEAINGILEKIENVNSDEYKLWQRFKDTGIKGRRTGSGITALADTYAALGVEYGDKEVTKKLFKIKLQAELDATIDLAIIRGSFPICNMNLEYNFRLNENNSDLSTFIGENKFYSFIKENFPEQFSRMITYGRRNISLSTIAPTGSVSLLSQTSSGIEPIFQPYYTRKTLVSGKWENYTVVHSKLKEWAKINCLTPLDRNWEETFKMSPYYKQCAGDLNWQKRIDTQSLVQTYISSSISSTINVNEDITKDEVSEIYKYAFNSNIKGCTLFRDNSKSGVFTKNNKNVNKSEFLSHNAPKRPKELDAEIHFVKYKGEQYAVVVGLMENKPYEVFVKKTPYSNSKIIKGKTVKLNRGKYDFISENITLRDIGYYNEEEALVAHCTLYTSMLLRHGADIKFICKTAKKMDENITAWVSVMNRVLSKYIPEEIIKDKVCPECGSSLIKRDGCTKCSDNNCFYTMCN